LAHALAQGIGCPAICRDEIKEGMVHAHGAPFEARAGDPLTRRTYGVFFEVIGVLVRAGVSVVADAGFQDHVWRQGLDPLLPLVRPRVVQCVVDPAIARGRVERRLREEPSRSAHADLEFLATVEQSGFARLTLSPSIDVDTTDGYAPSLAEIVAFIDRYQTA
jgi:predicted kinase